MEEFIKIIRGVLDTAVELSEVVLNGISLLFIVAGVFVSLINIIREKGGIPKSYPRHLQFRLMFGGWLVVALEFQLAADIVETIVSPNYENLIQLGVVALIRTFLNYFLNKELERGVKVYAEGA